ncbi:histidine kinase [Pseudoluteimonas lycopersici]|uniref:Histidine kinase n=1 Tax=Pseudoluteimonas lycopersici TaxID=1324796 RepID=A0A516V828_9GAMM|nr:FecR domain-containing protein [Lysobacter lycopersici]QDQ74681.1 histidine kinase [Lysobacter lycopersici]
MDESIRIEREAAGWLARRDRADWSTRDELAFAAWRDAETAHRVAYLRLDTAWRGANRLKAVGAGVVAGDMPARGDWNWTRPIAHHASSAPSALNPAALDFARRPAATRRRGWLFALAGCAMACAIVAFAWKQGGHVEQQTYRTALGTLEEVPLADGSHATLSGDSVVSVALSRQERDIDLQHGEAFFAVAKDASRPFVVHVDGREVVAVGTRFAVRRDSDGLRVVVTEGLVRLESPDPRAPDGQSTTFLPAGSVAEIDADSTSLRFGTPDEAERALSWRSGVLAFRDTPLATAAAEFNRYGAKRIVMGDADVAALRVGGNFNWANADGFVRLLEAGFPVRAERQGDRIVLHYHE